MARKKKAVGIKYPEAAEELEWYFTQCEAEMGISAQNYGNFSEVYEMDPESAISGRVLKASSKNRWVYSLGQSLPLYDQKVLALALEPRRWVVTDSGKEFPDDIVLRGFMKIPGSDINLIGLSGFTSKAKRLHDHQYDTVVQKCTKANKTPPKQESILEFLTWNAMLGKRGMMDQIYTSAIKMFNISLKRYDDLRLAKEAGVDFNPFSFYRDN